METKTDAALPNMPPRNRWLTDSVYPVSHVNPAATDAVPFRGPTGGKKLTRADVKAVPVLFVSNPTIKRAGSDVVVLAPGTLGIQKIIATDGEFELVSFLAYPGLEEQARRTNHKAIAAALNEADAARRGGDDAKLAAVPELLARLGLDPDNAVNGAWNLIDKDGCHYCVYGGARILKTTDDGAARAPLRVIRTVRIGDDLPHELARRASRVVGAAMTYDGFLAVGVPGGLAVLDRDLVVRSSLALGDETVESGIAVDERGGLYVVTSERVRRIAWDGKSLSTDADDGAWESEYDTMSASRARALGVPRTLATTPALMGFGDDPHKLVVVAAADDDGTNAIAFWRDEIPDGFRQKEGTKSPRIADQIRIDIAKHALAPAPEVLGYGVAFLNGTCPKPAKIPGIGDAFVSGVTRPAPLGIQKFTWSPERVALEKAWTNEEIDNTDGVAPTLSAATGEMYVAHKEGGDYQYVGLDWTTGAIKDRWECPDDSRAWNAFGGVPAILDNADLMIGGVFALKRVCVGARP